VVIEDLDGTLEVTAWPDVYQATGELWTEGAILLIYGKVRARGDNVTVVCERAIPYQAGTETIAAMPSSSWSRPLTPPQPAPLDDGEPPSDWEMAVPLEDPVPEGGGLVGERLILRLMQSGDDVADGERLRHVLATLREHPGTTPVRLGILNGGGPVWLDPRLSVQITPRLQRKLLGLLQESGVELERT
jgi:hypothetical protein